MKNKMVIFGVGIILLSALIVGGGGERVVSADKKPPAASGRDKPLVNVQTAGTMVPESLVKPALMAALPSDAISAASQASGYEIPCWSVNGGGIDTAASSSHKMGLSVGQAVADTVRSSKYRMGVGFWYAYGYGPCFCGFVWGDVNCDYQISPVDVIIMVNLVYKSPDRRSWCGPWLCPMPLGDVNCDGHINAMDVVKYVNYVYKGQTTAFCSNPCGY